MYFCSCLAAQDLKKGAIGLSNNTLQLQALVNRENMNKWNPNYGVSWCPIVFNTTVKMLLSLDYKKMQGMMGMANGGNNMMMMNNNNMMVNNQYMQQKY